MDSKKNLVVANWKMNPATAREALALFGATKNMAKGLRNVETVVCPPTIYLSQLRQNVTGHRCVVGAQDAFAIDGVGSHTGSISANMLKNAGASWVILGHSERRALVGGVSGGETNETINAKVQNVLKNDMKVILCVGERERDTDGFYLSFVREELEQCLKNVPARSLAHIVIAYEPIWAIGANARGADSPEALFEMTIYIRKVLAGLYGTKIAMEMPIIYGGSVDQNNAEDLLTKGQVRGFLVGRASLNPQIFNRILEIANR